MKKASVPSVAPKLLPSMLALDLELQVQPAPVVTASNNASGTAEALIHWQDLPNFEAMWESADVIKEQTLRTR